MGDWNTASVLDMSWMLTGCISFNQPIDDWDTSAVGTMICMFYDCRVYNQDLSRWNTTRVISINGMFIGASALPQEHRPSFSNFS